MNNLLLYVCTILLLSIPSAANAATTYRTSELKRLVSELHIDVAALRDGANSLTVGGRAIGVVYAGGQVQAVGYRLFSDEMKAAAPTSILGFLERYFLQIDYPQADRPADRMLREDRFKFELGTRATVATLRPDDDFAYHYAHQRYVAVWSRNGQPVLTVSFPANHELISGETKIEAEKNVEADIKAARRRPTGRQPNDSDLTATLQPDCYVKKGDTYLNDKLVSDLYYQRAGQSFRLLRDVAHPLESAANMMLSADCPGNYTLNIKQVMYGYQKKQFSAPLTNWIAYCLQNGCQLYFGVESMDGGVVKASVLAVNKNENFNHVLFVNIPLSAIEGGKGSIEARLETFIPMHNVKELWSEGSGKRR